MPAQQHRKRTTEGRNSPGLSRLKPAIPPRRDPANDGEFADLDSRPRAHLAHKFHLSPREIDVADRLVEGGTNAEIATALRITVNTVCWHLKNVKAKLKATSRAEVAEKLAVAILAAGSYYHRLGDA